MALHSAARADGVAAGSAHTIQVRLCQECDRGLSLISLSVGRMGPLTHQITSNYTSKQPKDRKRHCVSWQEAYGVVRGRFLEDFANTWFGDQTTVVAVSWKIANSGSHAEAFLCGVYVVMAFCSFSAAFSSRLT